MSIQQVSNGFETRIRLGKGTRQRFVIQAPSEAIAQQRAAKMRALARDLVRTGHAAEAPIVLRKAAEVRTDAEFQATVGFAEQLIGDRKRRKPEKSTTFCRLAKSWTSGTLAADHPDHAKAKKTADLDATRLGTICGTVIAPGLTFGEIPLTQVTLDHCERVMANLPATAKRPATRRQYAQLIHRVLALAVYPCRLIPAHPLPKGFMPKAGKPPAYPYLYPDEDASLMGQTEIPIESRMLYGFLAREGLRVSEAMGLQFRDFDFVRGAVSLDKNKTDDPRAWALSPGVASALSAWKKARGAKDTDRVFEVQAADSDRLSETLRRHLFKSGVKRPELHEAGTNRRPLRAHDLRGTFVTLSLANGKTETWVADRTGHKSSQMINRYRRSARSATELGLGPLQPLDQALPEFRKSQGGPKGGPDEGPNQSDEEQNQLETSSKPKWRNGRRGGFKIR